MLTCRPLTYSGGLGGHVDDVGIAQEAEQPCGVDEFGEAVHRRAFVVSTGRVGFGLSVSSVVRSRRATCGLHPVSRRRGVAELLADSSWRTLGFVYVPGTTPWRGQVMRDLNGPGKDRTVYELSVRS